MVKLVKQCRGVAKCGCGLFRRELGALVLLVEHVEVLVEWIAGNRLTVSSIHGIGPGG